MNVNLAEVKVRQTKKLVIFWKYLARQAYLADISRVQNLYVWSLPGSQQYGLIKIAITFVIDPRPKRPSICLETSHSGGDLCTDRWWMSEHSGESWTSQLKSAISTHHSTLVSFCSPTNGVWMWIEKKTPFSPFHFSQKHSVWADARMHILTYPISISPFHRKKLLHIYIYMFHIQTFLPQSITSVKSSKYGWLG